MVLYTVMNNNSYFKSSYSIYRAFIALLIIIHGVSRIYYNGISGFGQFLSDQGFPFGSYIAFAITAFEIAGGFLLSLGKFSKYIAPLFILELLTGILMIHAKFGWFVVGHSSNGVEYSLCLIVCFFLIWAEDWYKPFKNTYRNIKDPAA